jgi:cytochrome c peroxidase
MKSQYYNFQFLIKNILKIGLVVQFVLLLISCEPDPEYVPIDMRVGALPTAIIDPIDNPRTLEKIELGKMLFWDPILSGNNDVSCATCHHPDKGWGDDLARSIGVGGTGLGEIRTGGAIVDRNANTIINSAFNGIDVNGNYNPSNTAMFWDNRVSSLEEQSLEPIKSMLEMRGDAYSEEDAISVVSQRLANIPEYVTMFTNVFGTNTTIDGDKISKAIAAYERTIIANNSRFDQYARGDSDALNSEEIRGLNAFLDMQCNACHSGPMFSDYKLHDIGIPDNDISDNGVDGKFRTPTLRNLPLTGPYMHNGSITTLEEAIRFYRPATFEVNDEDAEKLNFDGNNIRVVAEFLRTLNDENFDRTIPESIPSGLPVGGNIQE